MPDLSSPTASVPSVVTSERTVAVAVAILRRAIPGALLAVFSISIAASIADKTVLDGESAVLSNPVIELTHYGRWTYPLHAQELFFPGVTHFMIHPPLHYLFASLMVALFGTGTWQLLAWSGAITVLGMAGAAYVAARLYGWAAGVGTLVLATAMYGVYFSADTLRCDVTFGAAYAGLLLMLGRLLFVPLAARALRAHAFLAGLLLVATLAAHWYGFFVQLYVVVLLVALWRGPQRLGSIGASALGYVLGFALWAMLYKSDLPKSLVLALTQGDQFRTTIPLHFRDYIVFLTTWPGGKLVEWGLILALVAAVARLALAIRGFRRGAWANLGLGARVDIYLLANLGAYFIWFEIFVGNKAPQYGGDLYFLIVPLAARGWISALSLVAQRLGRPALVPVGACVAAVIVLASAKTVHAYFGAPWNFGRPAGTYADVRDQLASLVPKTERGIVGVNAYSYLYDRDWVSPMHVIASFQLRPLRNESFFTLLREHLRERRHFAPYAVPPAQVARSVAPLDYIVTNENGEGYDDLMFDPRVWRASFVPLASVIVDEPAENQPGGIVASTTYVAPSYFVVFVRRDRAARYLRESHLQPGTVTRHGRATTLVYDARLPDAAGVDAPRWLALSAEGRHAALERALASYRWFGVSRDSRPRVLDQLYPWVDAFMSEPSLDWKAGYRDRTLGEAIPHAVAFVGSRALFR